MALKALENLVKIGTLQAEAGTAAEVDGLLTAGARRLTDAENSALSLESRFDLAYNAAHSLALAALRFHGYRSKNRYTVFQVLPHTLKVSNSHWRVVDQAHAKRNLAEYDGTFDVDVALVEAVIRVARELEIGVRRL